jgi:DNA-directed RNA polymerase subunit M/transcription elongation factor TFIIS
MKFCPVCENMYYPAISETDENQLTYYCRACGNREKQTEEICVLSTNTTNIDDLIHYNINEYTKFDPTLPRMYNMMCPNPTCETNTSDKKKKTEIVSIRYDDTNMKYAYICTTCDTVWR